jgi:hypothetical protein
MEKVNKAGSRWMFPQVRWNAAVLMVCVAPLAWAQDAGQTPVEAAAAEARAEPPMRVQIRTSALPRLEAQDSGFQSPRVDVSLFPANAFGVGAVFGMSGFTGSQPQHLGFPALRPSVDFGLRWNRNHIDITAWRRMHTADDAYSLIQAQQPVYGARVEMNLKSSNGLLALDKSFVGLQLQGGARITIKRKNGGPMVYYRTSF